MRECYFFFQAEDGIRDLVTGVQTCALPISRAISLRAAGPTGDCRVTTIVLGFLPGENNRSPRGNRRFESSTIRAGFFPDRFGRRAVSRGLSFLAVWAPIKTASTWSRK